MGEWRTDPEGRYQYRWWNGREWTDRVAHDGKVGVVPLSEGFTQADSQASAGTGGAPATTVTAPAQQADPPSRTVVDAEEVLSPTAGLTGLLAGGPTGLGDGRPTVVGQALVVDVAEPVLVRRGALVAAQGEVELAPESIRAKGFSSRGDLAMMWARGTGRVVLAAEARQVHIVEVTDAGLTVVAPHLLALGGDLARDVEPLPGGSWSAGEVVAMTLQGRGWVALSSHGTPLVLDVAAGPTLVDTAAALAWTNGMAVALADTFGDADYVGRGSGEPQQVSLSGTGLVIVQPSERAPAEAPR